MAQGAASGLNSFQSTRPRGARHRRKHDELQRNDVSIHAPARGATKKHGEFLRSTLFQSTRPRGARQRPQDHPANEKGFNPRAREGRDSGVICQSFRSEGFQSTRPRGARRCQKARLTGFCRFQSTRPRGARRAATHGAGHGGSFNPRAREGRDPACRTDARLKSMFQSTRPRGARHRTRKERVVKLSFQSTRPRGARQSFAR